MDKYNYKCNFDGSFNYGLNPCGQSIKINDNLWLCGDKDGFYCRDYCTQRCGGAIKLKEAVYYG